MTVGATSQARWWRPLGRSDRQAILVMVAVPILLFVLPALFGHPAIQADNLIQNFPLRVLSGRQWASGHLPLLDPYSNSGQPLLGGLNAGSVYPLTLLFAFIPAIGAWLLNLIAIYVTAALGMFLLLRWHGLRTLSSFAAAMSFTYTGAMIGQIVHLGVVQGFSFIPWTLLILVSLSRRLADLEAGASWRTCARAALPGTLWFAVLWGLTFLTGEPRAIAVIELLCLVCVPVLLLMRTSYFLTTWRTRVVYVASLAGGLVWGVGIGLVQLLPGQSFIGFSQRASISYSYFGAGSLSVRWLPLMWVQDMFGGNGSLNEPRFFAHYNLAEVTGYAGLLALVAAAAFLTRLTRRGWRGAQRDFVLYAVLGVVGLFATWGSFTPLGHLFHAIPLFGSTRLQSRNIVVVDFAVAVLLGWWFDRLQNRDTVSAGLAGRARWLTLLPAMVGVVICVALLGWGPQIVSHLGVQPAMASLARDNWLSLVLHLVVALATIAALVWCLHSTKLVRWLLVILSADVLLFLFFCSTGLVGPDGPTEPSRSAAVALLGDQGRTAFVDMGGAHEGVYDALGFANLDVFTKLSSAQGYGSLVSTIYGNATGTHPLAELNPCRLADGTFVQLRLSAVAISASQLGSRIRFSSPPTTSCVKPVASTSTSRYFGRVLDVGTVSLSGRDGTPVSTGPVSLQLLNASGKPVGRLQLQHGASQVTFSLAQGVKAAGFIVRSRTDLSVWDATVTQSTPDAPGYRLDTPFQMALSTSQWHLTHTVGTFAVIRAEHVLPADWLSGASKTSRITKIHTVPWGDSWVSVTAVSPVVLTRSKAYLPGWRATARNVTTGASQELDVERSGLIQKVDVPAGKWIVHFHYHAPYIEVSLLISFVSVLAMMGVSAFLLLVGRRNRKSKVLS
jgi:hypothetical protein